MILKSICPIYVKLVTLKIRILSEIETYFMFAVQEQKSVY